MTGPPVYGTDWNALYGLSSPAATQDRTQFWQGIQARLAAMHGPAGQTPAHGPEFAPGVPLILDLGGGGASPAVGGYPGQVAQQATPVNLPQVTPTWEDKDLVGAATYWGMPEAAARAMPRDHLIEWVNEQRHEHIKKDASWWGAAKLGLMPAAMAAVGAGEGLIGMAQSVPWLGDQLSKITAVHWADNKIRQYEEAIRSVGPYLDSNPQHTGLPSWASPQRVLSVANISGNIGSVFLPWDAALTFTSKAAGVARASEALSAAKAAEAGGGLAVPFSVRVSPIARAGVAGGLASYLLEGGTHEGDPDPGTHRAAVIAGGAILNAGAKALEPVINQLATRVAQAFTTPEVQLPTDLRGEWSGNRPPSPPEPFSVENTPTATPPEFGQRAEASVALPTRGRQVEAAPYPATFPVDVPIGGQRNPSTLWREMEPWRIDELRRAENLAAAANKAGAIIQSPELPAIAGQAQIDESSVVKAVQGTNPGGVNIVQGVGDPAKVVQAPEAPHLTLVPRGTRLDALTSDQPIPSTVAAQYEQHGVFEGQQVRTPDGIEGKIVSIQSKLPSVDDPYDYRYPHLAGQYGELGPSVTVQPSYSGAPRRALVGHIQPSITTPGIEEVPALWDQFSGEYLDRKTAAYQYLHGLPLDSAGQQARSVRHANLSDWMEDFLNDRGILDPGRRDRVRAYFNQRWVDSFKDFAPAEIMQQQVVTARLGEMQETNPLPIVQQIDQIAATKGFRLVPENETSWTLRNEKGVTQQFGSAGEAITWLRNLNIEVPDITPPSNVPMELIARHPVEPTQLDNTNHQLVPQVTRAIGELEGEGEGGGAGELPPTQVLAADGNLGRLNNRFIQRFFAWRPARRLMSAIDQGLEEGDVRLPTAEGGQQRVGLASDYDFMSQRVVQHHNDQHPWMDQLTDILRPNKTRPLVDGTWTRIWQIPDEAARSVAAQGAGINPEQFSQFDDLIQRLQPGMDLAELRTFVSRAAQLQSNPSTLAQVFEPEGGVSPYLQPFIEHIRNGSLNFREMDPRILGESFIRGVTWDRNMQEPFSLMMKKYQGIEQLGEQLNNPALSQTGKLMQNWLGITRYGYKAEDDLALDTVHGALQALIGPEVTRNQARELVSFGLNSTHAGMLGFRTNVMARDILQFFLAVPRAGDQLLRTMSTWMTDGAARERIWADAIADGAVQLQSPRMAAPGAFTGELERLGAGVDVPDAGPSEFTARHRALASVTGAIRDWTPSWLRDTRDSPLHAMYLYGKQSEVMRAITYTAGKEQAAQALQAFREAGPEGDWAQLMKDSRARTYDPAWQRQFEQYVANGQDDAAAKFLGRQLADATQFKYGTLESPWVAKSITGRVAMQFGNYPMQYFQWLRESLANGSLVDSDHVKLYATIGTVTAALEAASRKTGWNFRWMNPFMGLGFTGGPLLGAATSIAGGVRTLANLPQNPDPNFSLLQEAGRAVAQTGLNMFPGYGLWKTAEGIGQATGSPFPGRAITRTLLTGEQTLAPDMAQWLLPQAEENFRRSIQPQPSPVSITQQGLPAGVFPPQMVTDPPILQYPPTSPQNTLPNQPGYSGGGFGVAPGGYNPASGHGFEEYNRNVSPLPHEMPQVGGGGGYEQPENLPTRQPYSDTAGLDPDMIPRVMALKQAAQEAGIKLDVVETAWSDARQQWLYQQGRSRPGPVVTWTTQSAHQIGRGADIILNDDFSGANPAYQWLWKVAPEFGLIPADHLGLGRRDPGHIEGNDSSFNAVPFPRGGPPAAREPNPGGGAFF